MASTELAFSFLGDPEFAEAAKKYGLDVAQVQAAAVAAVRAKAGAYCTYSNFRVGAALLTSSALATPNIQPAPAAGSPPLSSAPPAAAYLAAPFASGAQDEAHRQIVTGANIENCSYPVGTCAERAAFATAVGQGHLPVGRTDAGPDGGKGLVAVAVAADTDEPCSPCGMCRQFMREFLSPDTPVFMVAREGKWISRTMGELLPLSFGASDLRGGQGRG